MHVTPYDGPARHDHPHRGGAVDTELGDIKQSPKGDSGR